MPSDIFMEIDGIKGESSDAKHKDQIEILSFNHGVNQSLGGSTSSSGGALSGRCDHAPLSIVKELDAASPILALACSEGRHIKSVTLRLNRAGGAKEKFMEYKLSDVVLTSVSVNGGGGGLPTEQVSMVYEEINWNYVKQNRADGTAAGNVASGWSLKEDKKL